MAETSVDGGTSGDTTEDTVSGVLATWRLLRASGDLLAGHTGACIELLILEWQEERERLLNLLSLTLVATACVLLLIGFSGLFMLAAVWETRFRVPVAGAMLMMCALGAWLAWRKMHNINVNGAQPFAAFREELAKDMALVQVLRKNP